MSNNIKEQISNLTFIDDGTIHTLQISKGKNNNKQRLILSYSSKRAKKDKYTRTKALEKVKDKLSKNITKSDLKLSYYAKYLDVDDKCNIKYSLNEEKIIEDEN